MELEPSVAQLIRELEERLLLPEVRSSADQVAALLGDDFIEFGSSGGIYNKQQIIELLQHEQSPGRHLTIRDFRARQLASEVILVTYRSVESQTIRSSIWQFRSARWQMTFHQGTRSDVR
jgi:hypothetical protein